MRRSAVLLKVLGCLGAVALATACTTQNPGVDQLSSNQFELRGMIANDEQQIDALKARNAQLQDQINELQRGTPAGDKRYADLDRRISALENEVKALQGGVPPIPGAATGGPAGGGESAATPPGGGVPPASLGAGGSASAAGSAASPPGPAAVPHFDWRASLAREAAAARTSSAPGTALYRRGLADMQSGDYRHALTYLNQLQHKYPKSPLSEPAEYFAANGLYESGKYDRAILEFNDVALRFPKGRFTPAALLREAQAFLKTNDPVDARLTLQKVLDDHGGTPEAQVASAMMKQMVAN